MVNAGNPPADVHLDADGMAVDPEQGGGRDGGEHGNGLLRAWEHEEEGRVDGAGHSKRHP